MDTLTVLMKARAEVEKGWCQGEYGRGGGVCMVGALYVAEGNPREKVNENDVEVGESYYETYDALRRAVGWNIPMWNDAPGRTQEDVLAAYDRAINAEAAKLAPTDPAHVHPQAA